MKEMTQNNETLVTELHTTDEMTGPWKQSRRTKLSEQIEEIQRGKHKFSQGSLPLVPCSSPTCQRTCMGLLPASRARNTRGCRHVMQTVQGWASCAAISFPRPHARGHGGSSAGVARSEHTRVQARHADCARMGTLCSHLEAVLAFAAGAEALIARVPGTGACLMKRSERQLHGCKCTSAYLMKRCLSVASKRGLKYASRGS